MSEHTNTPWFVSDANWLGLSYGVVTGSGKVIAACREIEKDADLKNARHIAHCVNNYERLVEMLTKLLAHPENGWTRHKAHALLADMNDAWEGE